MSALEDLDIVVVAATSVDDEGYTNNQPDYYGLTNGSGSGRAMEGHSPFGLYSRADDPDADGKGCFAFRAYEGTSGHTWLSYDPRAIELLPNAQKGDVFLHGRKGNFVRCKPDGSIYVSTSTIPGDTANGLGIYIELSPTDGFVVVTPWGKMMLGPQGFHVIMQGGARIDLGAISGLPPPFNQLGSYASIKAATVKLDGSAVKLGIGVGSNVARGDVLTAAIPLVVEAAQSILLGLEAIPPTHPAKPAVEAALAIYRPIILAACAEATAQVPALASTSVAVGT